MKKYIPLAIAYDFDGTLAPGNMQERDFIPNLKITKEEFWNEVGEQSKAHEADNILIYMKVMLEKARGAEVSVRKNDFRAYGRKLQFFGGILPYKEKSIQHPGWFDRIDAYGQERGVAVRHYIISSGIREMISGTPIAKYFSKIYASSFCYDHHGVATWPALAVNYTTKTQFIFRINKGALSVNDHYQINKFIPQNERPVPFEQIVFIGDGDTDIPCFRLVKDQGGHAIAVIPPRKSGAKDKALELLDKGRVNFITSADYRRGKKLEKIITGIIDKIVIEHDLSCQGMG